MNKKFDHPKCKLLLQGHPSAALNPGKIFL